LGLAAEKPRLVVAVALANKTAREAWAVMSRQDTYHRAAVPIVPQCQHDLTATRLQACESKNT
jgi:hypothetical protein